MKVIILASIIFHEIKKIAETALTAVYWKLSLADVNILSNIIGTTLAMKSAFKIVLQKF